MESTTLIEQADERKHRDDVEVEVIYAVAHQPAERQFSRRAAVQEVLQFAMQAFQVENTPEVTFYLTHDRTKVEDLTKPIEDFVPHNEDKVKFRLIEEKIYG